MDTEIRLREPPFPRPNDVQVLQVACRDARDVADGIPHGSSYPPGVLADALVEKGHSPRNACWAVYDLVNMGMFRLHPRQWLDVEHARGRTTSENLLTGNHYDEHDCLIPDPYGPYPIDPGQPAEWDEVFAVPMHELLDRMCSETDPDVDPPDQRQHPRRATKYSMVHEMLDQEGEPDPEMRDEFVTRYNQKWANKKISSTSTEGWPRIDRKTLGDIIRNRRK